MLFQINIFLVILNILLFAFLFFIGMKFLKNKKLLETLESELLKLKEEITAKTASEKVVQAIKTTTTSPSETHKIKRLEDEIKRLKNVVEDTKGIAQDAITAKSDFLTNIKHEVRTPMNSILVFSEILKNTLKTEELRTYASNILTSGHNLLSLLDSILEISSIDSGNLKVSNSPVEIRNFFSQELEKHQDDAREKGLGLHVNISKDIPESMMLDRNKIATILYNLLSNAIKFTSVGEVKMSVQVVQFNHTRNEINIKISIHDTGIGIIKDNQEKIFNIFESRDYDGISQYQCTGLGLSINRKLARMMDGDIKLQSTQNKGSIFTLYLNNIEIVLGNASQQVSNSKIDFSLIKKSKILIIDEGKETLDTISRYLDKTNVEVISYESTRDAIGFLHQEKIDLVCINVDILTMDEGAVSIVLRKIISAPVVGLVDTNLRNIHFSASGIQPIGHIKKPVKKVELFRALLKTLNAEEFIAKVNKKQVTSSIELSFKSDKAASLAYFKEQNGEINKLLAESLSTNNLNIINKFALLVKKEAKKHALTSVEHYATRLLRSIDEYDIKKIAKMLEEYNSKSRSFQKA